MKKVNLITLSIITTALFFSACSDSHFKDAETIIDIDKQCIVDANTTVINDYITMLSGDVLVAKEDENQTVIETYHDTNGTKKICIVSGKAYLIRQ